MRARARARARAPGANRPIQCQSSANWPIQCQSANPVPIGQFFANPVPIGQSGANPVQISQFFANPVPIRQSGANRPIQCQSGANSPIQRQSCTEIAYYGMPVSPSVNGRAVDRCNATESGLAQHWPALASSPTNPGHSEDNCVSDPSIFASANSKVTHQSCNEQDYLHRLKVDWHSIGQHWHPVQPILEILIYRTSFHMGC